MRPIEFGETLPAGTRLTLFSDDKPDRFFTVIKFWMDETSGVALALKTGVPTYQVEDEEGRTHLLIHLPIWGRAWTPLVSLAAGSRRFDSKSIFEGCIDRGIGMCTGRLKSFSQTLNSLHRRLTGQVLETAFDISG
jgi:hypothetical protein